MVGGDIFMSSVQQLLKAGKLVKSESTAHSGDVEYFVEKVYFHKSNHV